ncbi:hemocytin isoform X2 [Planococcus citri]|uniref:hemocytin isoform X2 n=1 Tax=Planococcus citri TaxID=170843 RepID=UPI0031F8E848
MRKINLCVLIVANVGLLFLSIINVRAASNFNSTSSPDGVQNDSADVELGDESAQQGVVVDMRFGDLNFEKETISNKKLKKAKLKSIDGDCGKFVTPINSASVCSNAELCQVTCKEGFATENGDESLAYACKNNLWAGVKSGKPVIEKCKAKCEPACQNDGKCVMPNTCQCTLNHYGPLCEFEKLPCAELPKTPLFSFRKCLADTCTISCMPGKQFPDGTTSVDANCENGKWIPSRKEWTIVPDCIPICNPPCKNGGKCIDTDTCFCPKDFRGEICQYPTSICDPSKLNFNGNYNCSGDELQFSCELSCPLGMVPEVKFNSKYTCLYSEGKFTPTDVPQCQIGRIIDGTKISQYESKLLKLTPAPASCMIWGPFHFKAFNGKLINFKAACSYVLVRDDVENLFQVQIDIKNDTILNVIFYINNEKYVLSRADGNRPVLDVINSGQKLSIPSQLNDLKVEVVSGKTIQVYVPAANLYLLWNLQDELLIDIGVEFWNRTSGLCGKGSNPLVPFNLVEYVKNAAVTSLLDKCESPIQEEKPCRKQDLIVAKKVCLKLSGDSIFKHCLNKLIIKEYMEACEWTMCNCEKINKMECMCQFFAKFVQLCNQMSAGVMIDWREKYNCTYNCPSSQVYTSCLPTSQATCASTEITPTGLQKYCEEGCVCAPGSVLQNDTCIAKETCSCTLRGKLYKPGSVIVNDCNKCTCADGKWSCTTAVCKAECVVLDPHYRTFDEKKYDFTGFCNYKLVSTGNYSIEMDNSQCSNNLDVKTNEKRCKTIIIRSGRKVVKLQNLWKITLDDMEVEKLPFIVDNEVFIRKASSNLLEVSLPNSLEVFWDGVNKLQIFAAPSLFGNTKGLCGVFNNNQNDDLLTPEGDIEQDPVAFANKWRTKENCIMEKNFDSVAICEVNIQNKPIAENYCKNLTSSIFEECHSIINPQDYYEDCLSDLCSCRGNNLVDCFCPVLSAYASKCAKNGIVVDWRSQIKECSIHCSTGQKFETCGNTCQRSCSDIAHKELCKETCVEGCYCPDGYTFDENENCVPHSECPCEYKNQKFSPNEITMQNETNGLKSCECKNALWQCREASEEELLNYKNGTSCPSSNMEYVDCEPPEPVTCRNMHNDPPNFSSKTCYAGCVCKKGYVLESVSKKCIRPTDCPCHHGGKSYNDKEVINKECNNCTCVRGTWECTTKECSATCSSWGDSHFRTFDGRFYDFQGTCDYVFAQGSISDNVNFTVILQIVPCGTGGTSCTKSVTLRVGIYDLFETLVLDKEKEENLRQQYKTLKIISTEMYIFAIIPTLSISLQWDKGTRVTIQAHPRWKNKINGLCGNYNDNSLDDFQTPSGGVTEVTPSLFADSWKLQQHCPSPSHCQDPCVVNSHRKFWAIEKCSYLKNSPAFKQCHSEVSVEDYYKRCVFDSCACDQGGDCECICTVFSAYAQECGNRGLHLKWRSQELCPIQCENGTEYSACVDPCPEDSCDSIRASNSVTKECKKLNCVEGCRKKRCPPGQIRKNDTSDECVSPMDCKCISIDGKTFTENEKITEDSCSSCYCSKGQMVCSGSPCGITKSSKTTPLPELPVIASSICVNGWSDWITVLTPFSGKLNLNNITFENTKDRLDCFPDDIKNISCRSKTFNASDFENVACSLHEKIHCKKDCDQFQIKFLCQCSEYHGPTKTFIVEKPPVVEQVCKEGWSEWLDISTPSMNKNNGEMETLKDLKEQDISVCQLGYISNIECKYRNSSLSKPKPKWALKLKKPKFKSSSSDLTDWRMSDEQDISCSPDVGFVCNNDKQKSGLCNDYQIRVLCSCKPPTTERTILPQAPICPPGSEWSDCKIECNQLCDYYKHELNKKGLCLSSKSCIPGCVNVPCAKDKFWRDESTCVDQQECTCATNNGSLAKPGAVIFENDCKTCQCINNEYGCSPALCGTTESIETNVTSYPKFDFTKEITTESNLLDKTTTEIIGEFLTTPIPLTPLPKCSLEGLITIDEQAKYTASSSQSSNNTPENAKLIMSGEYISNTYSWKPLASDTQPYLEIDVEKVQPIYGVTIAGNPSQNEWVKSYKVLYSLDNVSYQQAHRADNLEVFRGPYDHIHPIQQLFDSPIEARYIRIKPLSWEKEIAILVQVFGCDFNTASTAIPTSKNHLLYCPQNLIYTSTYSEFASIFMFYSACNEPMGIESGKMFNHQVSVSSSLKNDFKISDLSMSGSSGWAPFIASTQEWIQFDFVEERVIEGIVTKGTDLAAISKKAWIEAYKIMYSIDGVNWSPITDSSRNEKIFVGNVDSENAFVNIFSPPLQARKLKLYPIKWTNFPSFRVEILGCFKPYPDNEPVTIEEPSIPPLCNVCPGVQSTGDCNCINDTYWSGSACVRKEMCPCVEGLVSHSVGSTYIKSDCEKCTCSLGGIPFCSLINNNNCDNCTEQGLRRVTENDCNCHCEKCPDGTLLCPTTNFCLNETLWCNGYKECPDDETGCLSSTVADANFTTEKSRVDVSSVATPVIDECPPINCSTGYYAELSSTQTRVKNTGILKNVKAKEILKSSSFHEVVQSVNKGEHFYHEETSLNIETVHSHLKTSDMAEYIHQQQLQSESTEDMACKDWICIPNGLTCEKPQCSPGTKLITKWTGEACPTYECIVLPPNEKECSVNGKIISTFDGLSYIYDVCDHILAEDKAFGIWKIRKTNKCSFVGLCVTSLVINIGNDTTEIFSNLTAKFNGYSYTISQLQAIGAKSGLFVLQEISDSFIIFVSTDLKFSVFWGTTGNVKIIVDSSLRGMVDGLCGVFDFNIDNDKTKPDGSVVVSSQEFGDSWNGSSEFCEIKACQKDIQIKAAEICGVFRTEPFNVCDLTINLDDYIPKCMESLCTCANSATNFDKECRCQIMESFASKCLSLEQGIDISSWRIKYECPVNCSAPFVYHECYDRQCEPSCDSLLQKDECPKIENKCFPGCYCPDGLLRKGNSCIKPSECRDCECGGNGVTQFSTFDQVEIPFDGSCSSYMLLHLKNTKNADSELKVILTNAPCVNPHLKGVCPHGITVIVDKNEILLAQSEKDLNKIDVKLNNESITSFPHVTDFLKIIESPGISAKLSVPSLHLDIVFMSHNRGFSVQLPSHLYTNKLKGLCGSCNRDQMDDIRGPNEEIPSSIKEFLKSWRTEYTADTEKRNCSYVSQQISSFENFTIECAAPPENDPCLLFLNEELFGQCHPIVDPLKYVDLCHNSTCSGVNHCYALESYASECQKNGICSQWRSANLCPYVCPEGLVYEACSIGCEITCDNYKQFKEDFTTCTEPFVEKCVCPSSQVLQNGICINQARCHPCDKYGHFIGDQWQPDDCSLCQCMEDGSIRCQKKDCGGDIICPPGFQTEIDPKNDDPCCIKHICIAEFSLNCSEPIKPLCGKHQTIKMKMTDNNCTEYFCSCIPPEECPSIGNEKDVELITGMVRVEKKKGCCPSIDIICDVNTCPRPLECPSYFVLHEIKNSHGCCPEFKCELPPNTCIHEYEWIAEYNGSTRERLPSEKYKELKEIGDSWFDGPCKQCSCINGSIHSVCNSMICEEPKSTEIQPFVTEPVYYFGTCCPSYKKVACKANDLIYPVGTSWNISSDPCRTMHCVQNSETGEVSIEQVIQLCNTTCDLGERYVKSRDDVCCGRCIQEMCVDENLTLHYPNTSWNSSDGCIKYECTPELKMTAFVEVCPDVTDCPEESIINKGCCRECKKQSYSQVNCEVASLPLNDTIKIVYKRDLVHGICTNPDQIYGFTKCTGQCDTAAYYDERTTKYSSTCQCCVGTNYDAKNVVLTCEDGYTFEQGIQVPSACSCQSCADQQKVYGVNP